MSEARAAFQGSYCDLKFVRTRKVAQVVIEIPIEYAGEFIKAFGAPDPSTEIPVAIARLDLSSGLEPKPNALPAPEKRRWDEMKLSAQAGIRCNEIAFSKFLRTKYPDVNPLLPSTATPADETAFTLKEVLGISSRRELDTDIERAQAWRKLDAAFDVWMGRAT